ncbi:MAG TPA: hypothetical protein VMP01_27185 [Pirellulaceae bacterium]|nr:hypothetical protein [Pirellulaceae bacterium]
MAPTVPDRRWISAAIEFLRSQASRGTATLPTDMERAIEQARRIRDEGGLERDILEARLLSGQSYHEIANRGETTELAVEAFEQLFFFFRPFRSATDWVCVRAIRISGKSPAAPNVGVVLRKWGFFGGPIVLERLIETVRKLKGDSLISDLNLGEDCNYVDAEELAIRKLVAVDLLPMSSTGFILTVQLGFEDKCRSARQDAVAQPEVAAVSVDWRALALESGLQTSKFEGKKCGAGTSHVA